MSLAVCGDCSARYAPSLDRCPQCSSTARTQDNSGPLLPFLDVACHIDGCTAVNVQRRVYLRHAAPGVLERPALVCARCGYDMPIVRSWQYLAAADNDEETNMAKTTVHGGPSNAADPDEAPAAAATEDAPTPAGEVDQDEDTASPSTAGGPDDTTEPDAAADYATWTVEELRAELAERDLPTTGKKSELVKRLTDADNPATTEE